MIKIEVSPKRLADMIQKARIGKTLDSVSAIFSPQGISFSDASKGVIAARCDFPRQYFKEPYSVDEEYEVMFDSKFVDGLSKLGFSSGDDLTLEIDKENNCFKLLCNKKRWRPKFEGIKLQEDEPERSNYKLSETRIGYGLAEAPGGIGFLPTDPTKEIKAQFSIAASELGKYDVEQVSLKIAEGEKTTIELDFSGPFDEPITPTQTRKMTPLVVTLYTKMLHPILANFVGEIWVTIYEKAAMFNQVTEEYSLMYMMGVT